MKGLTCVFSFLVALIFTSSQQAVGQTDESDIDYLYSDFSMALMTNRTDEFRALLEQHHDIVNVNTLLHSVVSNSMVMTRNADGIFEIIRELVRYGADIEAKSDRTGLTPLGTAVEANNFAVADTLIVYGAKDDVFLAAMRGDLQRVLKYVTDDPACVNAVNSDDKSLLHTLAAREMEERARFQMEEASPRKIVAEGQCDVAGFLLEHGAEIDIRDAEGRTPLHAAAITGRDDILQVLFDHGADVNVRDSAGETALHLAVWHNRYDATEALIEHGAGLEAKDSLGVTAYQWAIWKNYTSVAELLAGKGATPAHVDTNRGDSWRNYLASPFDEKLLFVHMAAIGWFPDESIGEWYIGGVYRAVRATDDPYYVIDIYDGIERKGFKFGSIAVFDVHGGILRDIPKMRVEITLLIADCETSNDMREFLDTRTPHIVDLPDINLDGYAEIPAQMWGDFRERIPDQTSIFLTDDQEIPCVLTVEYYSDDITWEGNQAGRWPLGDIPYGALFPGFSSDPPTVDILVNVMQPYYNSAGLLSGHRSIPDQAFRSLGNYIWDKEKRTFTGPAEGPNGLWRVREGANYPR